MAIAVEHPNIGTNGADPGSTTITLTTNQTVASGSFIIISVGWSTATTVTITGGGLTWSTDVQGRDAGGPGSAYSALASAQAPSGLASGTVLTATFDVSAFARTIGGSSFTGVATSSPVDATASPKGQNVVTTAWDSNSVSILAGSMLIATCWNETSNPTSTPTSPAVEALDWINAASGLSQTTAYRIESSAGSYTVAGTWTSAVKSVTNAVAYKAAAGAPEWPPADTPPAPPLRVVRSNLRLG